MSKQWIPEWATHYQIKGGVTGVTRYHLEIDFCAADPLTVSGWEPIHTLPHALAIEDVKQQIREKAPTDMVNKPPHYQLLPGVEVYDVRDALMAKIKGATYGQVDDWSRAWEYLTRMWGKNNLEDAKKCRWYLNKLITKLEDQ